MGNNFKEPREFDVVLGGQAPPSFSGAVLGGIEGLHQRFASVLEQARLDALADALKYGNEGVDILVKALKDTSLQVRFSAYQILKQSNQVESEIAKGVRLNVGDKIYCVYRSSLYYGDDFYHIEDSMIKRYEDEEDQEQLFYKPQFDDKDGYAHYITAFTDEKEKACRYYEGRPALTSLHILRYKAFEVAENIHLERLLDIDREYRLIADQNLYDKEQLGQWYKDNGLSIASNPTEDEYFFKTRIFRTLQQGTDINLLNKFWEFSVNGRLAFVYERVIDRKCYLKDIDEIYDRIY